MPRIEITLIQAYNRQDTISEEHKKEGKTFKRRVRPRPDQKKPSLYKSRTAATKKERPPLTPREAVVETYSRWIDNHFRIDLSAQKTIERWDWETRDRAFFLEMIYGIVRQHKRIEWLIRRLGGQKDVPHAKAYACAASGIYQMLFLDRVPDFAIVDSAVLIARRAHGPAVAGWVNAILRRLGRERDQWVNASPGSQDKSFELSIKYSYPAWMLERWLRQMQNKELENFLTWNNRRPRINLRVNQQKTSVAELKDVLSENGIRADISEIDPNFLVIQQTRNPDTLKSVKDGIATVQDHAQGLVARMVQPTKGEKILDLCAAPGGKAGYIAEICPECSIIATDKDPLRLQSVENLIRRVGYSNITTLPYDEILSNRNTYDAIVIDAPCTGTGVLARRPDLRWRRDPSDVKRMASVQEQILRYAANRVGAGGRLIYSTCSVEPEENIELIEKFMEDHPTFRIVSVKDPVLEKLTDDRGVLSKIGSDIKSDGVFAVRLERSK